MGAGGVVTLRLEHLPPPACVKPRRRLAWPLLLRAQFLGAPGRNGKSTRVCCRTPCAKTVEQVLRPCRRLQPRDGHGPFESAKTLVSSGCETCSSLKELACMCECVCGGRCFCGCVSARVWLPFPCESWVRAHPRHGESWRGLFLLRVVPVSAELGLQVDSRVCFCTPCTTPSEQVLRSCLRLQPRIGYGPLESTETFVSSSIGRRWVLRALEAERA